MLTSILACVLMFLFLEIVMPSKRAKIATRKLKGLASRKTAFSSPLPVTNVNKPAIEAPPIPELRKSLGKISWFDSKSPLLEKVHDHEAYEAAVSNYFEYRRFNFDGKLGNRAVEPRWENFTKTRVIKGKEVEHLAWTEAYANRLDIKTAAEMNRVFDKIDNVGLKMKLQILWDETLVPIVKLRVKTGETGAAVYNEQIETLAAIVAAIEKQYEDSMVNDQRLYTTFLHDLHRELVPAPVDSSPLNLAKAITADDVKANPTPPPSDTWNKGGCHSVERKHDRLALRKKFDCVCDLYVHEGRDCHLAFDIDRREAFIVKSSECKHTFRVDTNDGRPVEVNEVVLNAVKPITLSKETMKMIRRLYDENMPIYAIASQYGLTESIIELVLNSNVFQYDSATFRP